MLNIIEQTLCFLLYAVVVADIVFVNKKPLIPVVRKRIVRIVSSRLKATGRFYRECCIWRLYISRSRS